MNDAIELPTTFLTFTGIRPKPETTFRLGLELQGQRLLTGRRGRPQTVDLLYPPHFYLSIIMMHGSAVAEVEFDELVQFQFFPLYQLSFGATLVDGNQVLFYFRLVSPAGCDLEADLPWEIAAQFFDQAAD